MPKLFFREAIARALTEEMTRDPRVILLGQDIGAFGGAYKETAGLHTRFGKDRVRDMPVAEAATVGMAIGAAAAGLRPVACITYMDFLTLGLDALVNYGAKLRYKTAGQLTAPVVIKVTAGAKGQGVAHSQAFDSWLMNVPGLKVVAPSTAGDAYGLLKSAIREDDPVVFIDHKRLFPKAGWVPDAEEVVPLGKASISTRGTELTVVAHGYMACVAGEAVARLATEGIGCALVDLRSLWPIDTDTIVSSAEQTGAVLFVEEGQPVCGVAAELAFQVGERVPGVRVARLGAARAPVSSNPVLEAYCIPTVDRVCQMTRALCRQPRRAAVGAG